MLPPIIDLVKTRDEKRPLGANTVVDCQKSLKTTTKSRVSGLELDRECGSVLGKVSLLESHDGKKVWPRILKIA